MTSNTLFPNSEGNSSELFPSQNTSLFPQSESRNSQLFPALATTSENTNLFPTAVLPVTENVNLFPGNNSNTTLPNTETTSRLFPSVTAVLQSSSHATDVVTQFEVLEDLLETEGYSYLSQVIAGLSEVYSEGL